MKKFYLEAYGCSANFADAEMISGLLKNAGFELVEGEKESDLNILVTCDVKEPTFQRMIYKIGRLKELKKPFIVAGCLTKTQRNSIEKIAPLASLLGPNSIEEVAKIAKETLRGKKVVFLKDLRKAKLCIPRARKNDIISIVPIAQGCLSNCSYCSIKFARGVLFSYPSELIVKEVERSVKEGCKEIWITSQDNSCYGVDSGEDLPELLKKICEIDGKFFVRVGMMNPTHMKPILKDLIDVFKSEKIFKFLHIPVQSGSDKVLKLMNRGYTFRDFIEIVEKFREEIPELTLSTDIILGFPGENESDFDLTVNLMKKVKLDIVNISKFGARPRTKAEKMEQIDKKIVNERSSFLHNLVKKISLEKNRSWIGWKGKILIDEKVENGFVGRNFSYKPIFIKTKKKIGNDVEVEIKDATENCLIAKSI
jgi:MiaB-like tRNA modifying enzyme